MEARWLAYERVAGYTSSEGRCYDRKLPERKEPYMEERSRLDTNQSIYEALNSAISAYPDREALVMDKTRLTYREVGRQVAALSAGLSRLGIGPGDHVAIILPNCVEGFLALFALTRIGATAVPLNIQLGALELRYILNEVDVAAVITVKEIFGRPYLPVIQTMRSGLPRLRQVIVKGGDGEPGTIGLETLLAPTEQEDISPASVSPDAVCLIFCTSGTTGFPKGVMHTHNSGLAMCDALLQARGRADLEIMLAPYPLFHVGGIVILLPLFLGGKLVILESFDPQKILWSIAAERVTCFAAVPLFFQAVLRVPGFDSFDLSSLRLVGGGGAAFSPDLVRAINTRFGKGLFFQGYGLTEAMWVSAATFDDPEEKQLYTTGRPSLVQAEVKIVDDAREILPTGAVGEVACRTTGMMKGYYNRPQETAEVLDEQGWLFTGDLGAVDEDGYLRLVDRKKDMIKRGAEAIFPAEIEHHLLTHPKIQMAAVVGVPSPIGGERIRAYVQPREGVDLSEIEVLEHCRGQIATYKIPQEVRFVSRLPLTATGKVQKFKLREEAEQEQKQL
jgi:acyl-CoA synthetase (AMP-forming)/AMP-acid ligase II